MRRSNNKKKQQSIVMKVLRWLMWTIISIAVIVGLALAFTQTGLFRSWVAGKIESAVNESVNGHLVIGGLHGNLLTQVRLDDVQFAIGSDTIAAIDEIRARYSPWPILSGSIQIDSLIIDSPRLRMSQDSAGIWNITRVVPLEADTTLSNATTGGFGYDVTLNNFLLRGGAIRVKSKERLIPRAVDSLYVSLSGIYTENHQALHLIDFRFRAAEPQFALHQLSFSLDRTGHVTTVRDVQIRTSENEFAASGQYTPTDTVRSEAEVTSRPIRFSEFAFALPDLDIIANPSIELSTFLRRDSLTVDLSIKQAQQSIALRGYLANLSSLVNSSATVQPRFGATIELQDVDPIDWLAKPPANFHVSGDIILSAIGKDSRTMQGSAAAHLKNCVFNGRPISALALDATYDSGNVAGSLMVDADFGEIDLSGSIDDLFGRPHTRAGGTLSSLNLAEIIRNDSLRADLNSRFSVDVYGNDLASLHGSATFVMSPSSFADIAVDTLETSFNFADGVATIDTIFVATEAFALHGKGTLDTSRYFNGNVAITLGDLGEVASFVKADSLRGSGTISGAVKGTVDSIDCDVAVALNDITYNAVHAEAVAGRAKGRIDSTTYDLSGEMKVTGLIAAGFNVDSLSADYAATPTLSNIRFNIWQADSMSADGAFGLEIDSSLTVLLSELHLNVRGQRWEATNPSRIVIAGDDYHVDSLRLRSSPEAGGEDQLLLLDGRLSLSDSENFMVDISHVDMATVGMALELPYPLAGDHSMQLRLAGTAAQPVISGWGKIINGRVAEFVYDSLYGSIDYHDGHLTAVQTLAPNAAGNLKIQAALSMNLSLTDSTEILPSDAPLDIVVTADSMSLTVLQAFGQHVEHVTGVLNGRLAITNTLNTPRMVGHMAVHNASFALPHYGIDYRDFTVSMSFDSTRIKLDTLRVQRCDGFLTGRGELTLNDDVLSGVIRSSEFHLDAKNFYVVQYRDYEVQVSGNAGLTGTPDDAKYSGTITVDRSRIYLPALMKVNESSGKTDVRGLPMLVRATLPDTVAIDTAGAKQPPSMADSLEQYAEFYKNLHGSLKLKFPRNSWIRSPDMQIEIGGDLDVVKESPDFELFGTVNVIRGHYDLYSRRFNIKEGKLVFQGGPEYDPLVTLEANYTFRTAEREKKTLTLFVSGKASAPKITFQLDGQGIVEGDAMAYLLFGKSLDQLSTGQRSQLSGGGEGEVAKSIAANFVSNKISQTIGKQLNLDVIEIKTQNNLSAATFTVGKYLTSDLFVSYQRGIGSFEDQDIAREQVTLEYELTHFIYLQLLEGDSRESGADVIFKYQRK